MIQHTFVSNDIWEDKMLWAVPVNTGGTPCWVFLATEVICATENPQHPIHG